MSADAGPDETRIAILKHELKEWEKVFATENGGRKPAREDIKRDAIIAAKYKEYDRLRRKPVDLNTTPRKRVSGNDTAEALGERPANSITATPRRQQNGKNDAGLLQAPAIIEEEPTPACVRFALGPTPQKDGEVLGIFDALPAGTPSKGADVSIAVPQLAVAATPSKHATSSSEPKLSRTPQSSGKRYFLGAFARTPLKRKREDDECTPSTAKRQFATPSFLRRNVPLARIDEEAGDGVTTAPPFKKRGLVRSLSSIIQGLRKQEEDRMDDEWEIMRELEEQEESENAGRNGAPIVLVEDSQAAEMPLGPDQGPELSDDGSDVDPGSLDANGNPRKVWKKKGQKRQTKRVKMRPVLHKPKKSTQKESSPGVLAESPRVEETQVLSSKPVRADDQDSDGEGDDLEQRDEESSFEDDNNVQGHKSKSKKVKKKKDAPPKAQEDRNERKDRKPKKINTLAHTNFRKLKIKNKNSKANGRGGRFGRR